MSKSDPAVPETAQRVVASATALDEARALLEQAEAAFEAAEQAHGRATAEEQARLDAEEDARIADLIESLPRLIAYSEAMHNKFRLEVFGLTRRSDITMTHVSRVWIAAAMTREWVRRVQEQITAHNSKRTNEAFAMWERKSDDWFALIQAALGRPHGGTRDSEDDDLEALAAANAVINEQSATAPRPLNRDSLDRSTPGPEDLGIVNPTRILVDNKYNSRNFLPIDFHLAFDEALSAAAMDQADDLFPRRSHLGNDVRFPSQPQVEAAIRDYEDRYGDQLAEAGHNVPSLETRVRDLEDRQAKAGSDE